MPRRWTLPVVVSFLACSLGCGAANLLSNGSFEQVVDGAPADWQVEVGAARAELALEEDGGRSGRYALRIVQRTARAPHVFSQLSQAVRVTASTRYTLSCYVRTTQGGDTWIGGGLDWQHRFAFPKTTEGWQRVTGSFVTGEGETQFTVRILSESPTAGTWVDDVQLEEGAVATDFVYVAPLAMGASRLALAALAVGTNLVPNPSFEVIDGVRPKGWMWDARNTDAALHLDSAGARLGKVAVRITNSTPFGAHVYGWFGVAGGIPVRPGAEYTLAAYVQCDHETIAWFGGGRDWKVRVRIPNTRGQWHLVSRVLTTQEDETVFPLMVVSESPTSGFLLDGLCLREGRGALPEDVDAENPGNAVHLAAEFPEAVTHHGGLVETRWAADLYPPGEWAFTSELFRGTGIVALAAAAEALVEVSVQDSAGVVLAQSTGTCSGAARLLSLDYVARLEAPADGRVVLSARVRRGEAVVAEARQDVRLVTPGRIEARLREVEAARERLRPVVEGLEARGLGDYARVTLTVLENFVPWARRDIADGRADRAWHAAETMVPMAEKALAQATAIGSGAAPALPVPRYVTSPLTLAGPAFVGARAAPGAAAEPGPIFFTGYGHFGQVRQDVEKFPGYGCNLIQIEFGPSSVLVAEDRVDEHAVEEFLAVCDRAAKANVSVNLLLSPHYFPQWALAKWPELVECRGGFLGYCVHAPEARQVLERFLRAVIPRIKDHPALHSLCLSNEPISNEVTGCRHLRQAWPQWLALRHGTIETLNRRWGTAHASFAEVPIPKPFPADGQAVDFVRFNQDEFAGFHRWLADVIHGLAPRLPVHAKIMMGAHFTRHEHGIWSVCPELFGELSQIHGNDCSCMAARQGDWANGWLLHQMAYDFQRSSGDKPVFNSENHVIVDRDHNVVPAGHLYSTLWQGALHGQSATTIWVWERTADHVSDLEGSVIHRPDAAEAIGHCGLDLMRLADEVTALQREPPQVLLYWSQSSVILGDGHHPALAHCYRNANFLGVPLGFVTDRQLERCAAGGELPHAVVWGGAKVLLVAEAGQVSDAALAGLSKVAAAGVRIVRAGPCFGADEYGTRRSLVPAVGEELAGYSPREREAFGAFGAAAAGWGLTPHLTVTAAEGGMAYGVEIRSARLADGRLVASLCNHRREPVPVVLRREGTPVGGVHLQSGRALEPSFAVPVLRPLLVEVR